MTSLLDQFRRVGRDLYATGLVSSHGGNMSVRRGEGLLITTHGSRLGHLTRADLTEVAPESSPAAEPSVDLALHQAVYAAVPQARAVVHAHPRHAITLSLVSNEIRPRDAEGRHYLGLVPVVPGDGDIAADLAAALRQHKVAVVAAHGSYAWGEGLWQALQWTSILEESAQVLWLARVLTGES
ncbi:MAG TPA: class II aldolase/adducin family protein [Dehalococcoidia bacterium]|nr:class II aldolase/adducin family protein [Dehalococcoidia bacterium]